MGPALSRLAVSLKSPISALRFFLSSRWWGWGNLTSSDCRSPPGLYPARFDNNWGPEQPRRNVSDSAAVDRCSCSTSLVPARAREADPLGSVNWRLEWPVRAIYTNVVQYSLLALLFYKGLKGNVHNLDLLNANILLKHFKKIKSWIKWYESQKQPYLFNELAVNQCGLCSDLWEVEEEDTPHLCGCSLSARSRALGSSFVDTNRRNPNPPEFLR